MGSIIFWVLMVWAILYILVHVPPINVPRAPRRHHRCKVYIDDSVYDIDPEAGYTLEDTMRMHEAIKAARAKSDEDRARLEDLEKRNWGHDIDRRCLRCRDCGKTVRDIYIDQRSGCNPRENNHDPLPRL